MRTRASVLGHPVHPMLVVLPIGALPTALALDVLRLVSGDADWGVGALVATLFGLGGMLAAIVPGVWDYVTSVPRRSGVRARATRHMVLGFGLAAFFGLVAALRFATLSADDARLVAGAAAFHALGVVGLAVQAWWGTGLVMQDGLGVEAAP